jgi:hypothetical protein
VGCRGLRWRETVGRKPKGPKPACARASAPARGWVAACARATAPGRARRGGGAAASTRCTPPAPRQVSGFSVAANGTAFTVGAVATAFAAAGANATWMPAPNASQLGALGTAYDYATWPGGRYEFIACSLARRAPEYVGACRAMPVTCGASPIDGIPYLCTGAADNATVNGNLSSSAYRAACELPCDLALDCAALCDCGDDGCAAGQARSRARVFACSSGSRGGGHASVAASAQAPC